MQRDTNRNTPLTKPQPYAVQQADSTAPPPSVLTEQTLSAQDVERICKAFIRLIVAKESNHNGHTNTNQSRVRRDQRRKNISTQAQGY